jgi:hypothetical protein
MRRPRNKQKQTNSNKKGNMKNDKSDPTSTAAVESTALPGSHKPSEVVALPHSLQSDADRVALEKRTKTVTAIKSTEAAAESTARRGE